MPDDKTPENDRREKAVHDTSQNSEAESNDVSFQRINLSQLVPKLEVGTHFPPVFSASLIHHTTEITSAFSAWSVHLNERAGNVRKVFNRLSKEVDKLVKIIEPLAKALDHHRHAKQVLRNDGLLPHITIPWELFDERDPDSFVAKVECFYAERWEEVDAEIIANIEGYNISAEAKAGFRDIMSCHRHGLYRAAVCTSFPVIEAEFRRKFELGPGATATSLKELRNAVGSAPLWIALDRFETVDLIRTLDEHLFEQVKTAEAVDHFLRDEVPNRHAATHGLIQYTNWRNSLNAIILADHVLFMMSSLQNMVDEQAGKDQEA